MQFNRTSIVENQFKHNDTDVRLMFGTEKINLTVSLWHVCYPITSSLIISKIQNTIRLEYGSADCDKINVWRIQLIQDGLV